MFDINTLIGLFLAFLVGITLGLLGSGGSILTVPILVYIIGINPIIATGYSLFIVGSTSLIGSIKNAYNKAISYKAILFLGIPSILSVFVTRSYLLPLIPNIISIANFKLEKSTLIMLLFSIVMLTSATKMIINKNSQPVDNDSIPYLKLIFEGLFIGLIAGTVGTGGGFLIVPTLIFLVHLSTKQAIATSLAIITLQSLLGFLVDVNQIVVDWKLIISFSILSIIGLLIGMVLSKKIDDTLLKKIFGYFVLFMSLFILFKELI